MLTLEADLQRFYRNRLASPALAGAGRPSVFCLLPNERVSGKCRLTAHRPVVTPFEDCPVRPPGWEGLSACTRDGRLRP
jgi:hypothetical protein